MTELRTCSRCKSTSDISYFGMNRKKEPYKTCDNCRNKQLKKVLNPINTNDGFLNYYLNLPSIDLEKTFDKDMVLECIAPLNHKLNIDTYELGDVFSREEGNIYKYKDFTEYDDKEYPPGKNSENDYMPDEYVSPVILKIDGEKYKTPMMTWYPLTGCSDAIRIKHHITNNSTYPIHIKSGKQAIVQIMNAIGIKYIDNLPRTITIGS